MPRTVADLWASAKAKGWSKEEFAEVFQRETGLDAWAVDVDADVDALIRQQRSPEPPPTPPAEPDEEPTFVDRAVSAIRESEVVQRIQQAIPTEQEMAMFKAGMQAAKDMELFGTNLRPGEWRSPLNVIVGGSRDGQPFVDHSIEHRPGLAESFVGGANTSIGFAVGAGGRAIEMGLGAVEEAPVPLFMGEFDPTGTDMAPPPEPEVMPEGLTPKQQALYKAQRGQRLTPLEEALFVTEQDKALLERGKKRGANLPTRKTAFDEALEQDEKELQNRARRTLTGNFVEEATNIIPDVLELARMLATGSEPTRGRHGVDVDYAERNLLGGIKLGAQAVDATVAQLYNTFAQAQRNFESRPLTTLLQFAPVLKAARKAAHSNPAIAAQLAKVEAPVKRLTDAVVATGPMAKLAEKKAEAGAYIRRILDTDTAQVDKRAAQVAADTQRAEREAKATTQAAFDTIASRIDEVQPVRRKLGEDGQVLGPGAEDVTFAQRRDEAAQAKLDKAREAAQEAAKKAGKAAQKAVLVAPRVAREAKEGAQFVADRQTSQLKVLGDEARANAQRRVTAANARLTASQRTLKQAEKKYEQAKDRLGASDPATLERLSNAVDRAKARVDAAREAVSKAEEAVPKATGKQGKVKHAQSTLLADVRAQRSVTLADARKEKYAAQREANKAAKAQAKADQRLHRARMERLKARRERQEVEAKVGDVIAGKPQSLLTRKGKVKESTFDTEASDLARKESYAQAREEGLTDPKDIEKRAREIQNEAREKEGVRREIQSAVRVGPVRAQFDRAVKSVARVAGDDAKDFLYGALADALDPRRPQIVRSDGTARSGVVSQMKRDFIDEQLRKELGDKFPKDPKRLEAERAKWSRKNKEKVDDAMRTFGREISDAQEQLVSFDMPGGRKLQGYVDAILKDPARRKMVMQEAAVEAGRRASEEMSRRAVESTWRKASDEHLKKKQAEVSAGKDPEAAEAAVVAARWKEDGSLPEQLSESPQAIKREVDKLDGLSRADKKRIKARLDNYVPASASARIYLGESPLRDTGKVGASTIPDDGRILYLPKGLDHAFASRQQFNDAMKHASVTVFDKVKRNLTALSIRSIKNNLTANFAALMIHAPDALSPAKMMADAKMLDDFRKGVDIGERAMLESFDRVDLSGADFIAAEVSAAGKRRKMNPLTAGYDKFAKGHIDLYRQTDNIPRRTLAFSTWRKLDKDLKVLRDGEWIDIEVGPGQVQRVTRDGDGWKVDGKTASRQEVDTVLARAGKDAGDKLFFDYADKGTGLRRLTAMSKGGGAKGGAAGFLLATNPFITWWNKAVDLPGKRGLVRSTVFDTGQVKGSSSMKLAEQMVVDAAKKSARRLFTINAVRAQYGGDDELRKRIQEAFAFMPEEASNMLVRDLTNPLSVATYGIGSAQSFEPTIALGRIAQYLQFKVEDALGGDNSYDALFGIEPEAYEGMSEADKAEFKAARWEYVKHQAGGFMDGARALEAAGVTGGFIADVFRLIKQGKGGRDWAERLAPMLIGGTVAGLVDTGATLADPVDKVARGKLTAREAEQLDAVDALMLSAFGLVWRTKNVEGQMEKFKKRISKELEKGLGLEAMEKEAKRLEEEAATAETEAMRRALIKRQVDLEKDARELRLKFERMEAFAASYIEEWEELSKARREALTEGSRARPE